MTMERELGRLEEKIAKLEGWRSRIVDVIPLAVLVAIIIGIFSTLVSMEHRLTVLEEGQKLIIELLKAKP